MAWRVALNRWVGVRADVPTPLRAVNQMPFRTWLGAFRHASMSPCHSAQPRAGIGVRAIYHHAACRSGSRATSRSVCLRPCPARQTAAQAALPGPLDPADTSTSLLTRFRSLHSESGAFVRPRAMPLPRSIGCDRTSIPAGRALALKATRDSLRSSEPMRGRRLAHVPARATRGD